MKTIETLLISQDEIDRMYTGELTPYLWRSLHKKALVKNPLYPDFDPREIRAGVLRAPDVEIKKIGGIDHVIARLGARHLYV